MPPEKGIRVALEKGSLDVWGRSQRQASVKRCGRRGCCLYRNRMLEFSGCLCTAPMLWFPTFSKAEARKEPPMTSLLSKTSSTFVVCARSKAQARR